MNKIIIGLVAICFTSNVLFLNTAFAHVLTIPGNTDYEKVTYIRNAYNEKSLRDSAIYQEFYGYCSNEGGLFSKHKLFVFKNAGSAGGQLVSLAGFDVTQVVQLVRGRGLSKRVSDLMRSPEFDLALYDCVGDDKGMRAAMYGALILNDIGGKALGILAVIKLVGGMKALVKKAPKVFHALKYATYVMMGAPLIPLIKEAMKSDETDIDTDMRTDIIHRMDNLIVSTQTLLDHRYNEVVLELSQPELLSPDNLIRNQVREERLRIAKLDLALALEGWDSRIKEVEGQFTRLSAEQVKLTYDYVMSQREDLRILNHDLAKVKEALKEHYGNSFSTGSVMVSGLLISTILASLSKEKLLTQIVEGAAKTGAKILAIELGAAAIGTTVGKYKASQWYNLKKEEVKEYLDQTSKAKERLDALDRSLYLLSVTYRNK